MTLIWFLDIFFQKKRMSMPLPAILQQVLSCSGKQSHTFMSTSWTTMVRHKSTLVVVMAVTRKELAPWSSGVYLQQVWIFFKSFFCPIFDFPVETLKPSGAHLFNMSENWHFFFPPPNNIVYFSVINFLYRVWRTVGKSCLWPHH